MLKTFKRFMCIFGKHEYIIKDRLFFLDTDRGEVCKHCKKFGRSLGISDASKKEII